MSCDLRPAKKQGARTGRQGMRSGCADKKAQWPATIQPTAPQPKPTIYTMNLRPRLTKTTLIFGGVAAWGLLLISCVSVNRTVLAPPFVAGAKFAGTKECSQCHEEQTSHFGGATHAKLALADGTVGATGCEACHGPGSLLRLPPRQTRAVQPAEQPSGAQRPHELLRLPRRAQGQRRHRHRPRSR